MDHIADVYSDEMSECCGFPLTHYDEEMDDGMCSSCGEHSQKIENTYYKCECGHIVHSSSKKPPESLNWSDGHVCLLIKQEEKEEK